MKESLVVSEDHINRFATIWAIVEARKKFPAMIVVTGATLADDTRSIARGLTEVAQGAGQRAGYLQLGADGRGTVASSSYAVLSVATRGSQRESFDAAVALWRSMYDIVVVDAAVLGASALGAHAARTADGVVIGVCDQRRVVPADRALARLLGELAASIIGAVMTAPISKADVVLQSRSNSQLRAATQLQ
jgi:hypothetical protein